MSYNEAILEAAKEYMGLEEFPGSKHNPTVVEFFAKVGHGWVKDDETPWCAAFVGAVLAAVGLPHTGALNARSYETWGARVALRDVKPGDVAVLWRKDPNGPYGHVGFVVRFEDDQVLLRGGNQGDKVSDAWYPLTRVVAFRRAVAKDEIDNRPLLQRGDRGAWVKYLQSELIELSFPVGATDGIFGPATESAVRDFQAHARITVDGVVGRETWNALRREIDPRPDRNVDEEKLRKKGSRTIAKADEGQKRIRQGAGAVGALATVEAAKETVEAAQQAEGVLSVLTDNIPALLIIVVAFLLWFYGDELMATIRRIRTDDAQSWRNMGR